MPAQTIHIEPAAPAKPQPGQPCNGCGLCCLLEPCPLGTVLSGRRHGACQAVRWDAQARRYRCGAMTAPAEVLKEALPAFAPWLRRPMVAVLRRLAARWIAAGRGCDSWLDVAAASPDALRACESDRQSDP